MTLRPLPVAPIPEETSRVAWAAFPKGNLYMRVRDELGGIYEDNAFAPLFSYRGQPAESPWRLALVTLMQFAENLPDRQAADAVRSRIDWKYALSLELTDSGFDSTVLCEFRTRLLAGNNEQLLLDLLLDLCRDRGWLAARGRQRTDSTHVLAAIQALNRLQCVHETLRHGLNTLALVAPDWLREHSESHWLDSYGPKADDYRLPQGKDHRLARAVAIGTDGYALLAALNGEDAPGWLREVPALETLQKVWMQQYYVEGQTIQWRTEKQGIPPSRQLISSPYDLDARLGRKRTTQWIGYKVHMTESCEEDQPHLITQVATSAAPIADGAATPEIHSALKSKGLLPRLHLVDTGYLDAELLDRAWREHQVDLVGPTRPDYKWQARESRGFDASSFTIDWEKQQATCPQGCVSLSWTPVVDRYANELIKIKFSQRDCQPCPDRLLCTRASRRTISIRRQEHHLAFQAARAREKTAEFANKYAKRAGIEGTISQGVRTFGLRRTRYIGLAKTHLEHVLTASAMNLVRIGHWVAGTPRAKSQLPAFVKLKTQPAAC